MSDEIKAPGSAGRFSNSFPILEQRRPVEMWPAADRAAWERALAPGEPFTAAGPAAHLAPTTRRARAGGFGQFLSFLDAIGELHEDERPEQRVTAKRLGGYIASLQDRGVAPRTIQQQIRELRCVLQVMIPTQDWSWVIKHPAVPSAADVRAAVQPKPLLDLPAIIGGGVAQLQALQAGTQTVTAALDYRDHLVVVLQAYRPLRRRNLAGIRLGQNLCETSEGYRLIFTAAETKTGSVIDRPIPEALVPCLQHYISEVRPFLLCGKVHDYLWVGRSGKPLGYGALPRCFHRIGMRLIGRSMSIHEFRHAAATLMVEHDPRDLDLAAAVLSHKSDRAVNENYDRSRRNSGLETWHQLRRKLQADRAEDRVDD